jgi:hypothetical protein
MKNDGRPKGSITKPLLKDLMDQHKANQTINPEPTIGSTPLQPPALYEDAGEGYNPGDTFPQE